jgi:hypothetical protein
MDSQAVKPIRSGEPCMLAVNGARLKDSMHLCCYQAPDLPFLFPNSSPSRCVQLSLRELNGRMLRTANNSCNARNFPCVCLPEDDMEYAVVSPPSHVGRCSSPPGFLYYPAYSALALLILKRQWLTTGRVRCSSGSLSPC